MQFLSNYLQSPKFMYDVEVYHTNQYTYAYKPGQQYFQYFD